jgi:adenosylcobinamide kinase/adenosylcobinamide-phosphate guanylyltransferase
MMHLITGGSGSGKSAYAEACVLAAGSARRIYIATMIPYGEEGRQRVERHRALRKEKRFETMECYTDIGKLQLQDDDATDYYECKITAGDHAVECKAGTVCDSIEKKQASAERGCATGTVCDSIEKKQASAERGCATGTDCDSLEKKQASAEQQSCQTVVLLECMSNLVANEIFEPDGAGEAVVEAVCDGIRKLRSQTDHLIVVTNEVFSDGITYDGQTMHYLARLGEVNRRLAEMADEVTEVVYGIPVKIKMISERSCVETKKDPVRE